MSDHNPDVPMKSIRAMDLVWDWSRYGSIGDSAHSAVHSYHTHFHVGDPATGDTLTEDIQYAQDDLWDAEWTLAGRDRHRAVKAARDKLRWLRKQEVQRLCR